MGLNKLKTETYRYPFRFAGSVLTWDTVLRAVRKFVKMPFGLGELPKEYNLKVHGPYDPAVYYSPKDTPLGQVKVKELPGWLARRGKGPIAIGRATSRAYWRWCHKYVLPTRSGMAAPIQFAIGWSAFFYFLNYGKMVHHRNWKHHW